MLFTVMDRKGIVYWWYIMLVTYNTFCSQYQRFENPLHILNILQIPTDLAWTLRAWIDTDVTNWYLWMFWYSHRICTDKSQRCQSLHQSPSKNPWGSLKAFLSLKRSMWCGKIGATLYSGLLRKTKRSSKWLQSVQVHQHLIYVGLVIKLHISKKSLQKCEIKETVLSLPTVSLTIWQPLVFFVCLVQKEPA